MVNIQWTKIDDDRMKFSLEQQISSREVHYSSAQKANVSPIATKIFGFPWTESITVGSQFVTIQKQNWVEWDTLAEPLAQLIKEHILTYVESSKNGEIEENPELTINKEAVQLKSPEAQKIQRLIEERINPAVADHGGFVSLVDYKDENVYVKLGGGCQGCSMSQATLKEGIATSIMEAFPQVKEVIDVTDHSQGETPFY